MEDLARRRCRPLFNEERGLLMLMYLHQDDKAMIIPINDDVFEETGIIYLGKMVTMMNLSTLRTMSMREERM